MKEHPFIAGMLIAFLVIAVLSALGLLAYPELIFIYRTVNGFFKK
ncbi:MAG: hypothetical protein WCR95_04205 [Eubacteriales bacterium]